MEMSSELGAPDLGGGIILGLGSVTEGEIEPSEGGTVRMGWGCWGRCPRKEDGRQGGGRGPWPGGSAWSTYLVGQPTPMPAAGGSSAQAEGLPLGVLRRCGLSSAPGALCQAIDLGVHRRIRGLAQGGGRRWGQLRAAEGEPGRRARQGGWAVAQAGWRLWQRRHGRGRKTEPGGQETQEDGDTDEGTKKW